MMGTGPDGIRTEIIGDEQRKDEEEEGEWNYHHCHHEKESSNSSTLERTALGVTTEIIRQQPQREEDDKSYQCHLHGENSSSSLTTTRTIGAMCNGGGGGDVSAAAVVAEPAEEWSPIRESPLSLSLPLPPHHQMFDRFPGEEPGSSSDMDTEEDGPRMRGPREGAAVDGFARTVAVHSDVDFVAVAGSHGTLDSGGGFARTVTCSFVPATGGEPASKRKRLPELRWNPVVEVTYEGLTRESKNVLQQALQSWSYWHSRSYASGMETTEEVLQSGTEFYSPALALEPTLDTSTVTVWMDKPLKKQKAKIQNRQEGGAVDKESQSQDNESQEKESQDKEKDVPLYDRAFISALTSQELENPDRFVYTEPQEGIRCFNCGSYSHSLRSCPRPRSAAAIRNARDTASNKRGSRPRTPLRYYQCSPGGNFDDLRPGVLSLEARKAIGIGELDPPPWLHRMREIGYPPGYVEDESSGVRIIDDDTQAAAGKESSKDGNDVENRIPIEEPQAGQKMTVDYPGINAPIPEKADPKSWATPPQTQPVESRGCKRPYHQISLMHNSGSGRLSPQSPWAGAMGDTDLRGEEGYVRSKSRGHAESYYRNRFDEMESQIDVYGTNLYGATSPVVNMNGNLSVDPASHWSKIRVSGTSSLAADGTNYYDARSGTQTYHHIPSSPSGLASPLRGMYRSPGAAEPISSTSHIYSRHNYYLSQSQGPPLPNSQNQIQTANPAWLKAQSALDAIQPSRISGDLISSPNRVPKGALQNSSDPRVQHQWGRR